MTTRRIAVVGIDGTGKSTVIRAVSERIGGEFRAFRSLQFYDDPDLPLTGLSKTLDVLSCLGDARKDGVLKACALFLGMTLFGPVERFVLEGEAPKWLLTERHPLVDMMTYASFYLAFLTRPLPPEIKPACLAALEQAGLPPEAWPRLEAWLSALPMDTDGFFSLPLFIRRLFDCPPEELLERLGRLCRTTLPDEVIHLMVPVALADERISRNQASHRDVERDLHESCDTLVLLDGAYRRTCEFLRGAKPSMDIHRIDTRSLSIPELVAAILRRAR